MAEQQPDDDNGTDGLGRPTKYRPEMCQIVIDAMQKGYSKEVAALECGISKDTFYAYIKKHPEFSDAVKEGERLSLKFWEGMGIKGMVGKLPGFNATTWIFNMKNRHGWRDKKEVTGPDGGPQEHSHKWTYEIVDAEGANTEETAAVSSDTKKV